MLDTKYTCTYCGNRHEMLTACPKEEQDRLNNEARDEYEKEVFSDSTDTN